MKTKYTTKSFIEKAKKIHGTKFDYSESIYNGVNCKIKIICPIHGSFEMRPDMHLNSTHGCIMCGYDNMSKSCKKTTEIFIEKSKLIYGDTFDYSSTKYLGALKKIKVICKKHGEFETYPNHHYNGYGCPYCNGKIKVSDFLEKSNILYSNKFTYPKIDKIVLSSKIDIICPIHGLFKQTPMAHLEGYGCSKCNSKFGSVDDFIRLAREKHGDKYDYSLVKINKVSEKVKIICPKHGEFEQLMANHANGHGCNLCGNEKIGFYKIDDNEILGPIYALKKYRKNE